MSTDDCLFCKVLAGEIPADVIFESDDAIAFRDINPQASTHVLIIPRQHIATINDLQDDDAATVGSVVSRGKTYRRSGRNAPMTVTGL